MSVSRCVLQDDDIYNVILLTTTLIEQIGPLIYGRDKILLMNRANFVRSRVIKLISFWYPAISNFDPLRCNFTRSGKNHFVT